MSKDLEMLDVIKKHKTRLYKMPMGPNKKNVFRALSYGRWAIDELIENIYVQRPMDVCKSIKEFMGALDAWLYEAKTEQAKDIYLSAMDTIAYIQEELIMLGYIV